MCNRFGAYGVASAYGAFQPPVFRFGNGAQVTLFAEKHHAIFVDTQAPFDRILQSRHSSFISWDRVHPNDVGHTALAMAFLRAMEFDFEA